MPDAVDMAVELEGELLAHALAQTRAPIAVGSAGECEQCDWWMPRLVEGRCGFCRDRRARPDDWEPPVPPGAAITSSKEPAPIAATIREEVMSKSITFVAQGHVLDEIKRRTADGTSNNRVALDLIEAGIRAANVPTSAAAIAPIEAPACGLDEYPVGELLEEVSRRLTEAAGEADAIRTANDRASAEAARADTAEASLSAFKQQLGALVAA